MNTLNRFKACLAAATMVALPVLSNGCSSVTDAQAAVCCTEFSAGATVDANIGGGAEAQVAVQAVADFAGIASGAIDDITTACRNIATDLGADTAASDKAEQTADKADKMNAWCQLAVTQITSVKASAHAALTINVVPPKCSASISAKANCQAKCSGTASCDVKANPPKCTGGTLEVSCTGSCKASGSAPSVQCQGGCDASCTGSCSVTTGSVKCAGKCDGTCAAGADAGDTGIQADGSCKGDCTGTCAVVKPGASCTGSCNGSCTGNCKATPGGAAVKCDGTCDVGGTPLECTGGKLEGGCQVDAKCDANCDASVSAKAECTPPSIEIAFAAGADVDFAAKLQATLETNLPLIFAFKSRLEVMGGLTATITGNADVIVDIKASCIPAVAAAAGKAVTDVAASVSAVGSIVGTVQ